MTLNLAADSIPWTEQGGFWVGLAGLLVALGSMTFGALSVRWAKRSALAAEASSVSSDRSADAAKASAESAEKVAHAELSRDHEMYRPPMPGRAGFIHVPNERTHEDNLFYEFTPPRGYRVEGNSVSDAGNNESRSPLSMSPILQGGRPVRVYVGELNGGPLPKALEFRLWPPVLGDPGESWTCRCGKDLDSSGGPHWELSVPVPQDANYAIRDSLG